MKLPALKEIVEERKGKAVESLSDSFAKNKLPLEEYERLVEYINKIESERELVVVEKIVAEYGKDETRPAFEDNDDEEPEYYPRHNNNFSVSGSNLTVLSSRTFSGPLKSGASFVSLLGSSHIVVRRSDLTKKKTTLDVVAILGDTVISVESGIRVSNRSIAILGGSWVDKKAEKQARNDDPEIVITGAAILGNITVKVLKL